tara:strand:+ start:921 stop:1532 length:612 start_codon:yes stop_codon:yes gene_type:complete
MNNKQLIKVVKTLVEAEVAKRQEHFLSKTFPKILKESVKKVLSESKVKTKKNIQPIQESDPFKKAEEALNEQRVATPQKSFTKNEILNKVLNETTPFSKEQRAGTGRGTKSVLDSLPQQQVNENTHIPSYMDAEPDIDQTVNMDTSLGAGGPAALRAQMAQKMGYQPMGTNPSKTGLGVQTGLPGLDRILNRDNSELVKKFKR